MAWFQIRKGVCQGSILSPCLFKCAEYIMRNGRLDEAQAGIKIARRNINNLSYADDTTLMAESEEELNSLLMKVKEEWKSWSKTQHSKSWDNGIPVPTPLWQIDGEIMETFRDFIFFGSKITADGDCSHEIKKHLFVGRETMTNLDSILKSRDITLLQQVCLVKAMVFPVVMCGCESWAVKMTEWQRIDAFELCWRRFLRIPWIAMR